MKYYTLDQAKKIIHKEKIERLKVTLGLSIFFIMPMAMIVHWLITG